MDIPVSWNGKLAFGVQVAGHLLSLFSRPVMSMTTPWTAARQASLSSPSPEVCPSPHPLHRCCHAATSSSDALFSFCPQSFPALGSFPVSWLFATGDQNTGVSSNFRWVSASVLPMSIQGWFPLRLTCSISLLSPLSGVFHSSKASILWRPAFFTVQVSQPYMTTGKTIALTMWTFVAFQHTV